VHQILEKLRGTDRRSIGRAAEVVADVLADPAIFEPLFGGMLEGDPVLRMRAADAVEKVSRVRPDLLAPFKSRLLTEVAAIGQQEVCWHVAQMIPRLEMNGEERDRALTLLRSYLQHSSAIVKTMSLQALADLAGGDPSLASDVVEVVSDMVVCGSPAVRSRARRLLLRMHWSDR